MNQTDATKLVNNEAEMGVVGLFLINEHSISVAIRDGFSADYIYSPNRKVIAECLMSMYGRQEVIDLVTVTQKLNMENSEFNAHVECDYCIDNALVTQGHLSHYIRLLRELAQKRELLSLLEEQTEAIKTETPADIISSEVLMQVSRISSNNFFAKPHSTMVDDMILALDSGHCGVVTCKHEMMRRKVGGFPRGKPTVLAARPGTGKSTFMCNEIAFQIQNGLKVGCLSLEMTKEELLMIMACEQSNISSFDLKQGKYDCATIKQFENTMRAYESSPLWISDRTMNVNQIVSWIKTMVTHHDLDIVYIDYIQRIRTLGKGVKRYEEVSSWAHMLTDVSKDTGVALVELCQISRAGEVPPGTKPEDAWKYTPKLHHLKETGALEEDAYLAILLYASPAKDSLDGDGLHLHYIADVAKHRGGPVGHIDLVYYKDKQRFDSRSITNSPGYSDTSGLFDDEDFSTLTSNQPREDHSDIPF